MTNAQRRVILVAAVLLCVCFTGHGRATEAEPSDPLTVLVFDYAGLEAEELAATAEYATMLFRGVRIATVWEHCRTEFHLQERPCTLTPDPSVLALRILPVALPPFDRGGREVFGFAFPPRRNGFANIAAVFWNRVYDLAKEKKLEPASLLAAVIAHEAGHLLLGPGSHFPIGLMKGSWDDPELLKISQRSLSFWSGQGDAFRQAVTARIAASRPAAPPLTLAGGKWPWVGI